MIIKTNEIEGAALNRAVAKCQGAGAALVQTHSRGEVLLLSDSTPDCDVGESYDPSTNWTQGGPIIERERINLAFVRWDDEDAALPIWLATRVEGSSVSEAEGFSPLIAAMRCFVASKLGDSVVVPDELKEARN